MLVFFEKLGSDSPPLFFLHELKQHFQSDVKGEITIVIGPSSGSKKINFDLDEAIKILIKNSIPKKDISKALSLVTDYSVNDLYNKIKDL